LLKRKVNGGTGKKSIILAKSPAAEAEIPAARRHDGRHRSSVRQLTVAARQGKVILRGFSFIFSLSLLANQYVHRHSFKA
jgi:hypothetical protein